MAGERVTYQDVAGAMRELLGRGVYPSWQLVREHVGDRGSSTTLQAFMRSWLERNGPAMVGLVSPEPSPASEASGDLREQLQTMTAAALADFDNQQRARIDALDKRESAIVEGEQRLASRDQAADAREQRLNDREIGFAEARTIDRARLVEVTAERDEARKQAVERGEALAAADGARIELESVVERLELQLMEREPLPALVATLQAQLQAARSETAEALRGLQNERETCASLRALLDVSLENNGRLESHFASQDAALAAAAARAEGLAADLATARAETAAASGNAAATRSELDAMALTNSDLKSELAAAVVRYTRQAEELRVQTALRELLQLQSDRMVEALPTVLKHVKSSGETP
ncbi:hypothetical protein LMG667_17450 [Xanthomonas euvesicatoria]|uniref:DNA-binding protein n=1 Tax=Xanthomonas euvesicatoria TaxID=456327 RepID=UPI00080E9667|nr:DNA-binding protein [Xanthomonas euvesicatoria]OCG83446.1 hypothetical protein LMG667_17450 [Xanthomonas euvesicatoria]